MKSQVFSCHSPESLHLELNQFLYDNRERNIEIIQMTQSEITRGSFLWVDRKAITLTIIYKISS